MDWNPSLDMSQTLDTQELCSNMVNMVQNIRFSSAYFEKFISFFILCDLGFTVSFLVCFAKRLYRGFQARNKHGFFGSYRQN